MRGREHGKGAQRVAAVWSARNGLPSAHWVANFPRLTREPPPSPLTLQAMHYLLMYDVSDDYLERRGEFRDAHLTLAWRAHEHGDLVLGGALTDPSDMAILLFRGDSPAVAQAFAESDPYVLNGLVKRWRVRPWMTVAGADAATPVRPKGAAS